MNAPATTTALAAPSLEQALSKSGLSGDGLMSLRERYAPIYDSLAPLAEQAREIKPNEAKKARALRLQIKEVRVAGDHAHKALKADILLRGRAIDGMQSVLDYTCKPIEAALLEIEEAEERAEAARKAKLQQERAAELRPFMSPDHIDLGSMGEEAWKLLLDGAKAAHERKLAEEERLRQEREAARLKAEEEARAKAEADRIERERLQAENDRKEKELAQLREQQRKAEAEAEARLAKERAEQKARDDAAAAERQKLAAAAEAEKRKRELAEAEAKRLRDEQEEKDRQERAAKRRAARAPDKEKVAALAATVREIKLPNFTSEDGVLLGQTIADQLRKMAAWLEQQVEKLS